MTGSICSLRAGEAVHASGPGRAGGIRTSVRSELGRGAAPDEQDFFGNNRNERTRQCVPLIAGLGKAAELARKHLPGCEKKVRPLRDALEEGLLGYPRPSDGRGAGGEGISPTELNGHKTQRLANTSNITFHGIESEALLLLLDQEGICASSGSACLADSDEPSHVVKAMKPESAASRQMIRFSLGVENTMREMEAAIAAVRGAVGALRG
jgi:cysteine desulfurase